MALIDFDGFHTYTNGMLQNLERNWVGINDSTRFTITASGRTGQGFQCATGANGVSGTRIIPPGTGINPIIVGFAWIKTNAIADEFFEMLDTGSVVHLGLFYDHTNQRIQLYRGSSGTILASAAALSTTFNTWNYIEVKANIHDTTGSCIVRVNETEVINFTGDTRNAGTANVAYLRWRGDSASWRADDLYVCDTTGPYNEDFLGDITVEDIHPSGAGSSTEFTPLSSTNHSNVDETQPDDDTTYNWSAVSGDRDTFALGNLAAGTGGVKGIKVSNRWRKDDAGARSMRNVIVTNGVSQVGATASLSTTYTNSSTVIQENPDTSDPWTIAEVNALEAGYESV